MEPHGEIYSGHRSPRQGAWWQIHFRGGDVYYLYHDSDWLLPEETWHKLDLCRRSFPEWCKQCQYKFIRYDTEPFEGNI